MPPDNFFLVINYYQSNGPHDCTANVVTIVVIIVAVSLRTFATVVHFTLIILTYGLYGFYG